MLKGGAQLRGRFIRGNTDLGKPQVICDHTHLDVPGQTARVFGCHCDETGADNHDENKAILTNRKT